MYSIIIADDHPLLLRGTKDFLESQGYEIVGEYLNGIETFNNIMSKLPNLAILDINMPGMDGLDLAQKLQYHKCKTKVILMTIHNDIALLSKAREYGVKGYVLKNFVLEELVKCITEVMNGKEYFSELVFLKNQTDINNSPQEIKLKSILSISEFKILKMIATGLTSKEIASSCFISEKTVESHRTSIIKKLNLTSEKNALRYWCLNNF
jgi:two-component system, NarL family, nitrate/nitrite response regulator NarL